MSDQSRHFRPGNFSPPPAQPQSWMADSTSSEGSYSSNRSALDVARHIGLSMYSSYDPMPGFSSTSPPAPLTGPHSISDQSSRASSTPQAPLSAPQIGIPSGSLFKGVDPFAPRAMPAQTMSHAPFNKQPSFDPSFEDDRSYDSSGSHRAWVALSPSFCAHVSCQAIVRFPVATP
eukprot:749514-Hanusia_phi.AAC.3